MVSPKLEPIWQRVATGMRQSLVATAAALIAFVTSQAVGSKEGYWGAITAIAVVQAEFKATTSIARNQFLGVTIGGLIALPFVLGFGQHIWSYGLAIAVSILCCWAANVPSASRLAGITVTIVSLIPHAGSVESMLVARLSEVIWGVCVAIGLVWATTSGSEHREPRPGPDRGESRNPDPVGQPESPPSPLHRDRG